jgi:transposase
VTAAKNWRSRAVATLLPLGDLRFCDSLREWPKLRRLARREHRAGEKLFVDYAGKKPFIVDRATGERVEVELFVAVLERSASTCRARTEWREDALSKSRRDLWRLAQVCEDPTTSRLSDFSGTVLNMRAALFLV